MCVCVSLELERVGPVILKLLHHPVTHPLHLQPGKQSTDDIDNCYSTHFNTFCCMGH